MARELPKPPKLLDLGRVHTPEELARLVAEWARGTQALLEALRNGDPAVLARLAELESRPTTPDFAAPGSILPDDAVAEGTADTAARSDHTHGITAAAAGAITPGDSAAEGAASSFARSDHKHSIVAAAAGAATPGDSAAEGSATSFARSDHKHSLPAFGSSAGTFCQGNDSRLSDARTPLDHASEHYDGGGDEIDIKQLGGYGGDLGKFLRDDGTFQTPGIGGIQTWFPDAPPTSAHSCDDEMDGGSIDGKWTENDSSSSVTWDVDTVKHMYRAVQTGNGAVRSSMLRQAVPASEFVAYCKIDILTRAGASGCGAGLFVADDLSGAPTTADIRTIELIQASGTPFRFTVARTWSAYNGTASAASSSVPMGHYQRIRVNGTTFEADVSIDGVGWYQVSSVTLGFTPLYFGLFFLNVDNTIEATGLWSFFRVQSGTGTSAYNGTYIGRYV